MKKQTKKSAAKLMRGFTLIELLVVMVIIGILAGIGISQFKNQQKKAKNAKITAECSQFERCDLLRKTCLEGGDDVATCDAVCDTSALACQRSSFGSGFASINTNPADGPVGIKGSVEIGTGTANRQVSGSSGWNQNTVTTQKILSAGEDGAIEWTVGGVKHQDYAMIGFSTTPEPNGYYGVSYGINFLWKKALWVEVAYGRRTNAHAYNYVNPYDTSTKFKIERNNGDIIYYKNGEEFYRSALGPSITDLYMQIDWNYDTARVGADREFQINDITVTKFE